MALKVIVLGTLGELVKKIIELELLEKSPSRDGVVQLVAYGKLLGLWPVEEQDKDILHDAVDALRVSLVQYQEAEKDMQEVNTQSTKHKMYSDEWSLDMARYKNITARYLSIKARVRSLLVKINALGKHIGPSPVALELQDEEEYSADSKLEHHAVINNGSSFKHTAEVTG